MHTDDFSFRARKAGGIENHWTFLYFKTWKRNFLQASLWLECIWLTLSPMQCIIRLSVCISSCWRFYPPCLPNEMRQSRKSVKNPSRIPQPFLQFRNPLGGPWGSEENGSSPRRLVGFTCIFIASVEKKSSNFSSPSSSSRLGVKWNWENVEERKREEDDLRERFENYIIIMLRSQKQDSFFFLSLTLWSDLVSFLLLSHSISDLELDFPRYIYQRPWALKKKKKKEKEIICEYEKSLFLKALFWILGSFTSQSFVLSDVRIRIYLIWSGGAFHAYFFRPWEEGFVLFWLSSHHIITTDGGGSFFNSKGAGRERLIKRFLPRRGSQIQF